MDANGRDNGKSGLVGYWRVGAAAKKYKVEKWRHLLENTLVIALQVSCMLKTPFINIKISQRLLSIESCKKPNIECWLAQQGGEGTAVASYYEVPRVVAIE